MKRIDAIREIAAKAKESSSLLVANIGVPCKELYNVYDMPNNFYMLGSMGLASSIGLGLALSIPDKKVLTIEGDGSVLMNMGSLATIASFEPENYLLVIIDNGSYGSTGNQPTATSRNTDLAAIAKGAGNKKVCVVDDVQSLKKALLCMDYGIIVVKAIKGNSGADVIELNPEQIIDRFMDISSRPSQ